MQRITFQYLIFSCVFFLSLYSEAQTTIEYTEPGTDTFVVPAGVTEITVEAWGAGGRGGSRTSGGNSPYGGGGGGAYSVSTLSVNPGEIIDLTVGAGSSTNVPGGDTEALLNSNIFVKAAGGNSVPDNSENGATGGSELDGVGDVRFSGGNGSNAGDGFSGGGGSSAGTNFNGNTATNSNGASAPADGGRGGDGSNNRGQDGSDGLAPGGGGGGAFRRGNDGEIGGSGGNGLIKISYIDSSSEGEFGDGVWNVSAYNGTNFDTYRGFYVHEVLDFDTRDLWDRFSSPSSVNDYQGFPVDNDNHSYTYKRRGFPCGFYQLNIPGHDDDVRVIIDGEVVFTSDYTGGGRVEDIWQGFLGPNSEIEYSIVEFGGESFGSLEFVSTPDQFVWRGTVDSSVTNIENWCGGLPSTDGTSNIYIPANAPNFPVVDNDNFVVNNIELEDGASLTLTAELEIRGSLINNGTFNAQEGSLNFVGPQNHGIGGNGFAIANLRMDSDLTLDLNPGEEIDLSDILSVDAGTLTTNDRLNLTCSFATGKTAQVGPVGGNITGKVSVEQCYPARRAFRLIASSVTSTTSIRDNWQAGDVNMVFDDNLRPGYGTHITGVSPGAANATLDQDADAGFDYNPSGAASMFTFDNIGRSWGPVTSTLDNLEVGQPYRLMIRGDRSIDVTSNDAVPTDTKLSARGTLQVGPYTIDSGLSTDSGDLNFIANPYHAQIDTKALVKNSENISGSEYYIWDPTLGGTPTVGEPGGRGAFVTYDLEDEEPELLNPNSANINNVSVSRYVQPMQGFFVRTSGGAPVVRFDESIKAVNQQQTQTKSFEKVESIGITLFDAESYAEGNTPSDVLRIKFNDNYSKSTKDDSPKLGNLDENFSREEEGKSFAIDRRPLPEETEELMLSIKRYRRSSYVMEFKVSDGLGSKVFIKDNYLDKTTEITKNQSNFSFEVDQSVPESSADDRFSILLDPIRLSTREEEQLASLSLYPNPTKGNFSISGLESATDTAIEIYNLTGQQVYKRSAQGQSSVEVSDFNASSGVYLVKLKSDQGEKTFKLIKQ